MSAKAQRRTWLQGLGGAFRLKEQCSEDKPIYNKSTFSFGDQVKVVPGRESHMADIQVFDDYVDKLEALKREQPSGDSSPRDATAAASSEKFWAYVRSTLESSSELVGFEGDPDGTAVVPKGPRDYDAFARKAERTEIINPINPVTISAAFDVAVDAVLEELLYATKVGLVSMKWAPTCERCLAPVCTLEWDVQPPVRAYCQGCRYENTVECLSKIKVFFVLSQDAFYVLAANFQCTASDSVMQATEAKILIPPSSSGSGWRVSAGCGGAGMEYRAALPPGLYRMHCPIIPTQNYLRVEREVAEEEEPCRLEIRHSKLVVRPGDSLTTLTVPHGRIHFDIFPDTMSEWLFWIHEDLAEQDVFYVPENERRENYLTALKVMKHPKFQHLFRDEADKMIYDAVTQMEINDE